jgi:hypothetical protein
MKASGMDYRDSQYGACLHARLGIGQCRSNACVQARTLHIFTITDLRIHEYEFQILRIARINKKVLESPLHIDCKAARR